MSYERRSYTVATTYRSYVCHMNDEVCRGKDVHVVIMCERRSYVMERRSYAIGTA